MIFEFYSIEYSTGLVNLYAINNSARAETRANRVRTNNNQFLLSGGSDAYSTVYAILQYGVRIRINEYTESDSRANRHDMT